MMMSLTNARAALWAIDITSSISGLWTAEISFTLFHGLINCTFEHLGTAQRISMKSGEPLQPRDFRRKQLEPFAFDAGDGPLEQGCFRTCKGTKFDI